MRAITRSVVVGVAAGALVLAMLPGATSAGDPIAGCPTGTFNIERDDAARWFLLNHLGPQEIKKDHNGDGWVCSRRIKEQPKHDLEAWAIKDNTKPWGRYRVIPENGDIGTWKGARAHCKSLGAHLVTIDSAKEDRAVWKLVRPDPTWIGASDKAEEGVWRWVTGERLSDGYANWATGEPNNADGVEHYAAYNSSGTWVDVPEGVGLPSVCEYE